METLAFWFDLDMSLDGWIALGLTVIGVAGLHLGLMRLALRPWDPDAPAEGGGQEARSAHDAWHPGGWQRRGQP